MTEAATISVVTDPSRPAIVRVEGQTDLTAALGWLAAARTALRDALREHGSLLVRGLPMTGAGDFARIRDVLLDQRVPYREKATPRSSYGDDVFSSTDLPAAQPIAMHNENSYTLEFPGVLLFGCLEAPARGGATTVADVRRVLALLPPELVDRFRRHGWMLVRTYSDHVGLPWQTAFGTDDPAEVAAYCAEHLIGLRWTGGHLRTAQVRPAIIRHPVTGEEVWFNHAAFWNLWALDEEVRDVMLDAYGPDGLPFATFDGAGGAIGESDLAVLRAAYEEATVREPWRTGDIMLVDNVLSAHGRDAFAGPRRIVVAMGEPVALADCHPSVAPRPHDPAEAGAAARTGPDAGPPGGALTGVLAMIWADVLGVPAVGPDDDFFALGGQSLLAMRVCHRIREYTGVRVPVSTLYDHRRLSQLAGAVAAAAGRDGAR